MTVVLFPFIYAFVLYVWPGVPVSASIQQSLEHMAQRVEGCGGAVAVSRDGEIGVGFSTPRMPWAYVKDSLLHYGIHPGQHLKEEL